MGGPIRRDIMHSVDVAASLVPAVRTATGTGTGVDLLGYESAMAEISTGAIAGAGLFTWGLEESNDNSSFSAVAAADLQPDATLAALTSSQLTASMIGRVGYIGKKRYIRVVLTYVSGTSLACAASVIRGRANQLPLA